MTKTRFALITLLAGSIFAQPARGAVVESGPAGFMAREEVVIQAAPDIVYDAVVKHVDSWWDPEHTYSQDAKNLSIDPMPGGCFCEKLPNGGGVRHLTVEYVEPGKMIRFSGALGPLARGGLTGSLTFSFTPADDSTAERGSGKSPGKDAGSASEKAAGKKAGRTTKFAATYSVGGYLEGGLEAIAPAVDSVLGDQIQRLQRYVETGEAGGK